MSYEDQRKTRRSFLAQTGKVTLAAGAGAAAIHLAGSRAMAQVRPSKHKRRKFIVPGSPRKSFSRAVRLEGLVYVSGCVGRDEKGTIASDFEQQASQALLNLKASVEASGSSLHRVLKCGCFLKEVRHFSLFNEIYMKFFPKDPPARSTVVVKDLVAPGAMLEIDCVCYYD